MKYILIFATLVLIACGSFWFMLTSNSNEFSRARLNDGICVEAPDSWRWCRDGIEFDHFCELAGDPSELGPKHDMKHAIQIAKYDSGVVDAPHVFGFNIDGYLVSADWFSGLKDITGLSAPKPLTNDGVDVSYPRCVPISWAGDSEMGFQVEVQIFYQSGEWAPSGSYFTNNSKLIHQHTGANEGRWRVRAISKNGGGTWSDFVKFGCTG